jgi:hypothetical protein
MRVFKGKRKKDSLLQKTGDYSMLTRIKSYVTGSTHKIVVRNMQAHELLEPEKPEKSRAQNRA